MSPLYDYLCEVCGNIQEVVHSIKDKCNESCSNCNAPAEKMKRIISVSKTNPDHHISWSKWQASDSIRRS
jgi:putative FmdB family regulatory protein